MAISTKNDLFASFAVFKLTIENYAPSQYQPGCQPAVGSESVSIEEKSRRLSEWLAKVFTMYYRGFIVIGAISTKK
jgi:hypothetical protein